MRFPLVAVFLLSGLISVAQGFTISGHIKGLPAQSTVAFLELDEKDTLAKARVGADGRFTLRGKLTSTDSRMLLLEGINRKLVLFIGNDSVQIRGTADNPNGMYVSGSEAHTDYENFMWHLKPINDYVAYYRQELQRAERAGLRDSIGIMLNTVYTMFQHHIDLFIDRKPHSPVSSLLLAYSFDTDPNASAELAEKRYARLQGEALKSRYAEYIANRLKTARIGAVGTRALDFTQNDVNGKPVSLSSFKGKYVLVDFWASWCGPCRLENPNVVAAYKEFRDKNFTVLGVSLDQDRQSWLAAIKKDGLEWTQVSDLQYWNNAAARLYNIQSIPQNLLIDPDGNIIARNLRGPQLIATLRSLLK